MNRIKNKNQENVALRNYTANQIEMLYSTSSYASQKFPLTHLRSSSSWKTRRKAVYELVKCSVVFCYYYTFPIKYIDIFCVAKFQDTINDNSDLLKFARS